VIDNRLEAFELKSDFDNFGRLHNQIHAYNRVFDRITLVTGSKLCDAALDVMPNWWGIWSVSRGAKGELKLKKIRNAKANPGQDFHSLATLLWRNEAAAVLQDETGELPSGRASRAQLYDSLATHVTLPSLRRHVVRLLAERQLPVRPITAPVTVQLASAPDDGWLHHDASCLDFHFPT
jgi:hypothetical protein